MADWKEILQGVAPTLATAIGGPFAGAATKFLSDQIFGDENADPKDLHNYLLQANPEQLAVIKQLDNDFALRMKEMDVDLQRLGVDNTKDARKMATATTLWPQAILTMLFVVGYFMLMYLLLSGQVVIPQATRDMIAIMLGVLTSGIPMMLKFWFGGSPNDDKQLDRIYNSTPRS